MYEHSCELCGAELINDLERDTGVCDRCADGTDRFDT